MLFDSIIYYTKTLTRSSDAQKDQVATVFSPLNHTQPSIMVNREGFLGFCGKTTPRPILHG